MLSNYKGKIDIFSFKPNTLFYRKGELDVLKHVTPAQICNELNRYYEAGRRYLDIMGDETVMQENELKLADKAVLLF